MQMFKCNSLGLVSRVMDVSHGGTWDVWAPVSCPPLPCSICVRVAQGSFLHHYNNHVMLHCGISDTSGLVYNFDERGPVPAEAWQEAVCVPVAGLVPYPDFDSLLVTWHQAFVDAGYVYHVDACNCFDYVTWVVSHMSGDGLLTKHTLALYLEPALADVAQFVEVWRCMGAFPDVVTVAMGTHPGHAHNPLFFLRSLVDYACNACGVLFPGHEPRWRCVLCDVDLCMACCMHVQQQYHHSFA